MASQVAGTAGAGAETRESWAPMIAIALGQAIMSFNVASLPVSIGGMVQSFGVPPTTIGTGIVMYSLAVAGFVMLGAKLVQRFGATRVFRAVIGLFGVAQVLMTFSPVATVMLVAQLLAGLAAAVIGRSEVRRRGRRERRCRVGQQEHGSRERRRDDATGTVAGAMSETALFGLGAAALVGLGLYGFIIQPEPLRKLLAFNLLGSGVFLLFGVIARRGAAAGMGGDPIPQAIVITGIIVAFAGSALAVGLLLRLSQETARATLSADAPPDDGGNARS